MGNNDGITIAFENFGKNEILRIENGKYWFSFALGDEIALTDGNYHFILNCSKKLWAEVKEFVKENTTIDQAIEFWKQKSEYHNISKWSHYFGEIDKIKSDEMKKW